MELLNPTITITNTDAGHFLVRYVHKFDEHQFLDFTVRILKAPNRSLDKLTQEAFSRLGEMIPKHYRG